MKVLEYVFPAVSTRKAQFSLYPLGDVHIGAFNCAEKQFRRVVKMIDDDPMARWYGGGDMIDAVILQDQKRFDPNTLPNWLLADHKERIVKMMESKKDLDPDTIAERILEMISGSTREKLRDMVKAQQRRFLKIVEPIADKCIGLLEGNHEYSIMKYHNRDIMNDMCEALDVPNLTDCCFIRFRFEREKGQVTYKNRLGNTKTRRSRAETAHVRLFTMHGNGGGRTPGSEPNHLARLASDKIADIVMRGHSHTQHIMPPIARLTIPTKGKIVNGDEVEQVVLRAANWGCYLRTYAAGPSTYDSRAAYPARPLSTVRVIITPFRQVGPTTRPKIKIEELEMY